MNISERPTALNLLEANTGMLDLPTLELLLREIEEHAEVTEVIPRFAQRGYVPEGPLTLAEARKLLLFRSARGVQISYRYDGADWSDTILMAPEGFRRTRVRQELAAAV
jgi:hypothetical protein